MKLLAISYLKLLSTNCSLNEVKFGDKICEIEECSYNLMTCRTPSGYYTHYIDNSGVDLGNLLLKKKKIRLIYS